MRKAGSGPRTMGRQTIYLRSQCVGAASPEARDAVIDTLDLVGNPSSVHARAGPLRAPPSTRPAPARCALAGAERDQVVFTGSATEAITQAIVGGAQAFNVDAIVVSEGDHAAVLKAAEATGLPVKKVGLDADGLIRVEEIATAMRPADSAGMRLLVAIHLVNNETGVIQPVDRIEVLVGPSPHYLFVDAVQGFGKIGLDFASRAPDLMAVSAHKIGGPGRRRRAADEGPCRPGAADSRRRPGKRPARRHRELRRRSPASARQPRRSRTRFYARQCQRTGPAPPRTACD